MKMYMKEMVDMFRDTGTVSITMIAGFALVLLAVCKCVRK